MNTTGVSSELVATLTPPGSWLLCRVGDRALAIELDRVLETMRPLPLRVFSGVPGFVLGASVIRGAVVPVIDAGTLLGGRPGDPGRYVTIRVDDRTVALAVDGVLGVRTLDGAALQHVPALLGALDQGALAAIGTLDSGLLLVLGAARLVPQAVWERLDAQRVDRG